MQYKTYFDKQLFEVVGS